MMAMLFIGPILEQFVAIRTLVDAFMTAIVLSMLNTITHKKSLLYFGGFLAIIMLVSLWLKYFDNYNLFATVSIISGILLTIVVTAHMLTFIIKSETVTGEVVYAAMLVYLLVAQLWALVYLFLDRIDTASRPH
jgi:hypothetical protein